MIFSFIRTLAGYPASLGRKGVRKGGEGGREGGMGRMGRGREGREEGRKYFWWTLIHYPVVTLE